MLCVKCGVNEQMEGSQLCEQCSNEGVRVAAPTPEDMQFVRQMRMVTEGKPPLPCEILDLLALFEKELGKGGEGMAIERAYNRYINGERVE